MSRSYNSEDSRPAVVEIRDLKIDYRNLNHFSIQKMIRNPALKGGNVLHAVRGVDLTVREGEVLGIVGENGAGKSTLLKAVAGIFRPDDGSIDIHGRRVSLMSLGVGFKWELSGRENIMLAGLLLRYPASYIQEKLQEIIDFSELEEAIDRPVRTYSDGMYAKLSFAITAVLETDIMLIDELLSVGDEEFQKKSFRRIQSLVRQEKMTGMIVSHDMELIQTACTRAVWMHSGRIRASGKPDEIVEMYRRWSMVRGAEKVTICGSRTEQDPGSPAGKIRMFRGLDVKEESGLLYNTEDTAANWEPLYLPKGTAVSLREQDCLYKVFVYRKAFPEEYIYTGAVHPEGNWTGYDREHSAVYWNQEPVFLMEEDGYVRIAVRKKDRGTFPVNFSLESYFRWEPERTEEAGTVFTEEAAAVKERIASAAGPGDFVFLLLADTHVTFGGIWPDTAANIKAVAETVSFDAAVHLGDVTDGLFPEEVTDPVIRKVEKDLSESAGPVCFVPGNHDLALFPGRKTAFSGREFAERYMDSKTPYKAVDFEKKHIRMILLSSYDPEQSEPYGFSDEETEWLKKTLADTPEDRQVLVFSHVLPGKEKTRWGETVRNSRQIMHILEEFDYERSGGILGLFYGHDHRDAVIKKALFPVVGVGCAKLEDTAGAPLHSGIFTRKQHTGSQELWDAVIVRVKEKELDMIRFGAGEDRHLSHR